MPDDRRRHWTASPGYSVAFLLIFVIAFFPNLFVGLLHWPASTLTRSHQHKRSSAATPPPSLQAPSCCCGTGVEMASWFQKTISLTPRSRGSYLVTDEVTAALPELKSYRVGLLHLFAQHTSCALSLNENWDADVRADMSDALDRIAPVDPKGKLYRHSAEGDDDMPVCPKLSFFPTLFPCLIFWAFQCTIFHVSPASRISR